MLFRSQQGGYHTGIAGRSYHLDGSARGGPEISRLMEQHQLRSFAERVDYLRTGSDTQAVVQLEEFLDGRPAGKPFAMWLNFSDPHHPWDAPTEFRPATESLRLPPHWPDLPGMRAQLADYCAEVNRVDATMGKVLAALERREIGRAHV